MAFSNDFNKPNVAKSVAVAPNVVKTYNIAKEILSYASRCGIDSSELDFNILDQQTFTRKTGGSDDNWVAIDDELSVRLMNDDILDPSFEIRQLYEIEIYQKLSDSLFADLNFSVGANSSKSKVYICIKKGSIVKYVPAFDRELRRFFNKVKARAGILTNIFDEPQDTIVARLSAKARVNGVLEFSSDETFLIAEAFEPIPTTNDEVIIRFEKRREVGELERVDHSDRGFIRSVAKGDVLIEYIKARRGEAGRNCRGEYIGASDVVASSAPTFSVDPNTIDVQDDETHTLYIAKIDGYISKEGSNYTIKAEMDLSNIDFKTTGSIYAGVESGVVLNIKESGAENDAIGSGMVVEASEVIVEGNVGSNAKIFAKKVVILGQTHKSATIHADEIDINVHKGKAFGNSVKITRLEQGEVEGRRVNISQAMGGSVRAKDVAFEICSSKVRVVASNSITINKLKGDDNSFTIDPLAYAENIDIYKALDFEVTQAREAVEEISSEVQKYEELARLNIRSLNEIKEKIGYYKENNIKIPPALSDKLKKLLKAYEHIDLIKGEKKQKLYKLELLEAKLATFQESIFSARVCNNDVWSGYNEVIFRMISPKEDVTYMPVDGSVQKSLALVKSPDGRYKIKQVDEDDSSS